MRLVGQTVQGVVCIVVVVRLTKNPSVQRYNSVCAEDNEAFRKLFNPSYNILGDDPVAHFICLLGDPEARIIFMLVI